jgi:cysteine desulfurase
MKAKYVIYADNAATTRLDPLALEAMLPFLTGNFSNPSALYSFGKTVRKAVETARQQIADCIGATPQEIFFTSCGTESDNWAIKGAARALRGKGQHIITTTIEHHAVLQNCAALEKEGFLTTQLAVDSQGLVSVKCLNAAITPQTTFVSVMLANNEIGTIQDIQGLATDAHHKGLVFHTDAVQALGHIPVNVAAFGVDLLSASAHKFNGPKGVGFLYKKSGTRIENLLDGGAQESGSRAGTENVAGIVGMAIALQESVSKLPAVMSQVSALTAMFKARVKELIPDVLFNGSLENSLPGHISLSLRGVEGEAVMHILDMQGVCISTGSACNSKSQVISHVIKAIGVPREYAKGTLRVTLGKENTFDEVKIIAEKIAAIYAKSLRKIL